MRVGDAHDPHRDAADLPGCVPKLEHVARRALDREILVQGADEGVLGLEQHAVVGHLGNRAAGGQGEHARAAACPKDAVYLVAMHQRRAAAASRREAVGQHGDDGVEVAARDVAVGPRAADEGIQAVLACFAARDLRRELLGEDVEWCVVRHDAIEIAAPDGPEQRGTLDEVVARDRQQPALRCAGHGVAGSAHALEERRDAMGRSNLAHQVDVADIDPELERCRRDQCLERAGLEPVFGIEPRVLREAAVVRGDLVLAEPIAQVPREALRQPSRVDEDERCVVRADQLRQPVVILLPDLVLHHGAERRARNLDLEVERAAMTFIDDRAPATRLVRPDQEASDLVDRLLRRREAEAEERPLRHLLEPLERERQVRAPARADDRMDLVHYHGPNRAQQSAAALRREQQVERLRRGHQDVRRLAQDGRPFGLRGIAGPDRGGDARRFDAHRLGELADPAPRFGQVLVNVGAQRLQWRDIDDPDLIRKR